MIPYELIVKFIISGIKFKYLSYDHHAAVEELNNSSNNTNIGYLGNNMFTISVRDWTIPDEVKQNNIVWRTGKIRKIHFNPDGKMWKFYIGAKRAKGFYLDDFGVNVKPIIFKSDDHLDLIGRNLAVEDKM